MDAFNMRQLEKTWSLSHTKDENTRDIEVAIMGIQNLADGSYGSDTNS
jgi:hypothetical protein